MVLYFWNQLAHSGRFLEKGVCMRSLFASLFHQSGADAILFLAVAALGLAFFAHPASAAQVSNLEPQIIAPGAPMDGNFTAGPTSSDLVPYSQVKAMIECDIFLGCNGQGDLSPPKTGLTIVCLQEDDMCSPPLKWYEVQAFADQYQDAGLDFYDEGTPGYKAMLHHTVDDDALYTASN